MLMVRGNGIKKGVEYVKVHAEQVVTPEVVSFLNMLPTFVSTLTFLKELVGYRRRFVPVDAAGVRSSRDVVQQRRELGNDRRREWSRECRRFYLRPRDDTAQFTPGFRTSNASVAGGHDLFVRPSEEFADECHGCCAVSSESFVNER